MREKKAKKKNEEDSYNKSFDGGSSALSDNILAPNFTPRESSFKPKATSVKNDSLDLSIDSLAGESKDTNDDFPV